VQRATETRWIVLCSDGRHSSLGRHSDPTEEELASVAASLTSAGLSGWLAVMKGAYYTRARPELLMVRPLAGEPGAWEEAARAFEAIRQGVI
jgi:hypothetical protein